MTVEVVVSQGEEPYVDRDNVSTPENQGRQGFDIWADDVMIHFQDEQDAVDLAKAILRRMGELPND